MASIEEIKGQISTFDFNYGNRFDVQISSPARYTAPPTMLGSYIESVSLPGRSFATSDIKVGTGFTQKRPYNSIFDDVVISVRMDKGLELKKYFDGWQNLIHNKGTGYMEYLDNYKAQMNIMVYDRSDSLVYQCQVLDCYPIAIAALDFNHSTQNDIAKLSVTFAYKTWGSF